MSKLTPASLFYLPSQAAHLDGSFFEDYAGPKRALLDPYVCADYAANHVRPEAAAEPVTIAQPILSPALRAVISPKMQQLSDRLHAQQTDRVQAQRDTAIQTWRTDGGHKGVGNRKFFELGLALAKAGMPRTEIDATLRSETYYARSPSDRRKQVPSILRSLRLRIGA